MANKRETSAARQERLEAIRRQQQRAERRRLLIGTSVVVVVLAALVIGVVVGISANKKKPAKAGDQIIPSTPTGQTTVQSTPKTEPNKTGIKGVTAYDTEGWPGDGKSHTGALAHDHVDGPVTYAVLPPVGGPHNGTWMNAGVYTKPIPSERAVHNLEHGAIWITYRPNLAQSQVRQLQDLVGKQSMIDEGSNSNRYMDLSPWASNALPSPIVVSSWGYQLKVDSPTDPRIQQFIDKFRHNKTYTPEFGAAVDGIPVDTGGRPALYGSKFANPSG
ncbi:MAG TPA: DUF3105 domain-containing protein [Marmoricola sp.]